MHIYIYIYMCVCVSPHLARNDINSLCPFYIIIDIPFNPTLPFCPSTHLAMFSLNEPSIELLRKESIAYIWTLLTFNFLNTCPLEKTLSAISCYQHSSRSILSHNSYHCLVCCLQNSPKSRFDSSTLFYFYKALLI